MRQSDCTDKVLIVNTGWFRQTGNTVMIQFVQAFKNTLKKNIIDSSAFIDLVVITFGFNDRLLIIH